ncbi:MAG: dynamin family protein [Gammaproteobacteria bacterium]|nr:MAG: dynamin family protein [Gammaproteobacteria bacterium]
MSVKHFEEQLQEYDEWKSRLICAVEDYQDWLNEFGIGRPDIDLKIMETLNALRNDKITVAFVAEFSRGKTELINALFFANTGTRLLPSSPGRTTMCPTEIFYDNTDEGAYIRLLAVETRMEEAPVSELKKDQRRWMQIDLDPNDPAQLREAFRELVSVKEVLLDEAVQLGLYSEDMHPHQKEPPKTLEIPCWRHAIISYPHPLLEKGLTILDTPGLNALGSEPELTLSMLPSAQAMIFVLAADTGVTKSDLEIWQKHIKSYRSSNERGLAVVMNKIDTLWDDLDDAVTIDASIRAQVTMTARTLDIDGDAIFPLSAKQALLGKVKNDAELVDKSQLAALENYLSESVLGERQTILNGLVSEDIGQLVDESISIVSSRVGNLSEQLEDLRKLEGENEAQTLELMRKTREEQKIYQKNVERLRASRKVFVGQAQKLIDALNPATAEEIIQRSKQKMVGSWTTSGMKAAMKTVFEELHGMLNDAVDNSEETQRLVKAIYRTFEEEHGFEPVSPRLFAIVRYQLELERLFNEGEQFRQSASTALMGQGAVVKKLFGSIVGQAYDALEHAHREATVWGGVVLNPLLQQVKEHKQQTEHRLEMLRKISESSGELGENTEKISRQLSEFEQQQERILKIQALIEGNDESASSAGQEVEGSECVESEIDPFAVRLA